MEVHVTISVRNPEWYWSAQKIKESEGYYEEWKALNADKVWKTLPSWPLKLDFDVDTFTENRNTDYELKYSLTTSPDKIGKVLLNDMTHVVFRGKEENEKADCCFKFHNSFLFWSPESRKNPLLVCLY